MGKGPAPKALHASRATPRLDQHPQLRALLPDIPSLPTPACGTPPPDLEARSQTSSMSCRMMSLWEAATNSASAIEVGDLNWYHNTAASLHIPALLHACRSSRDVFWEALKNKCLDDFAYQRTMEDIWSDAPSGMTVQELEAKVAAGAYDEAGEEMSRNPEYPGMGDMLYLSTTRCKPDFHHGRHWTIHYGVHAVIRILELELLL